MKNLMLFLLFALSLIVMSTFAIVAFGATGDPCDSTQPQAPAVMLKGQKGQNTVHIEICPGDNYDQGELAITLNSNITIAPLPGLFTFNIITGLDITTPCGPVHGSGALRGHTPAGGWSVDQPVADLGFRPCTPTMH